VIPLCFPCRVFRCAIEEEENAAKRLRRGCKADELEQRMVPMPGHFWSRAAT